jgi:hypothetical protein
MSEFNKKMIYGIINKNRSHFTDAIIKSVCNGHCPRECPLAPIADMDIFGACSIARRAIMPDEFEKKYNSNSCGSFLIYIKNNLLKRTVKI